jgi:hypothetical protein
MEILRPVSRPDINTPGWINPYVDVDEPDKHPYSKSGTGSGITILARRFR